MFENTYKIIATEDLPADLINIFYFCEFPDGRSFF